MKYLPKKLLLKKPMKCFALAMVCVYLGYNAMHGEQGLLGGAIERYRQEKLSVEMAKIKGERQKLEHKISLLSGDMIDIDLLDELARRELPLIGANQIIMVK